MRGNVSPARRGAGSKSAPFVGSDEKARLAFGETLHGLAARSGFDFYLVATFPRGDKSDFASNHIASNWPKDLTERYSALDTFRCSQLVAELKSTILPVFLEARAFSKGEANQNLNGLSAVFAGHGLERSIVFSLHDSALRHYIFAFSGVRGKLSDEESMALLYGVLQALESFSHETESLDGPRERLSMREVECLRWSAAGKSSEEIAIILDISAHTVASYLKSAMRKLESVNRMQAVARACRYRLL